MQTDTRTTLIETALVRRRGYSAVSYADLAAAVGIRKPSIHHHFPSKGDLAAAVVATHIDKFSGQLDDIDSRVGEPLGRIEAYAGLCRDSFAAGQGCLCGVLASELGVLPPAAQAEVRRQGALCLALTLQDARGFDAAVAGLLAGLRRARRQSQ